MCSNCSRKNFKDLTGKKFGRLLVLSKDNNNKSKRIRFLCRCDCGNIISAQANHLVDGSIKNCINCKITSKGEEKVSVKLLNRYKNNHTATIIKQTTRDH